MRERTVARGGSRVEGLRLTPGDAGSSVVPPRRVFGRGGWPAVLVAISLFAACAPRAAAPGGVSGASSAPEALERFLRLALERDYAGMGWIFGTAEGSVMERDPAAQVEERMYLLAGLLANDRAVVGSGSPVPGRGGSVLRFDVTLQRGGEARSVPFLMVRGPSGRWFVERLDVEVLAGGP